MSKRTASEVDEEFLINNVHMRAKGSIPFQRQATEEKHTESGQMAGKEGTGDGDVQDAMPDALMSATASRPKREPSQKRPSASGFDYDQIFLVRNEIKFRKAAYLSVANHDAISRIVKELGNGQLSVGGYLDLIVTAHLEQYRDRINAIYRTRRTSDDLI